jgi:hypothetical protein
VVGVVVVLEDVVVLDDVLVVDDVLVLVLVLVEVSGGPPTGIDMKGVVGMLQTTAASPSETVVVVVSDTMLIVMVPDCGAVIDTVVSGVVSVAKPSSDPLPAGNGPGVPNFIWFACGNETVCGVDVLVTFQKVAFGGWWPTFPALIDW